MSVKLRSQIYVAVVVVSVCGFVSSSFSHQNLECLSCHATQPIEGQAVNFVTGDKGTLCAKCHEDGGPGLATMAMESLAIVNSHSPMGSIPEEMKQHMIQWLADNGYPPYDDPNVDWYYSCESCHSVHVPSPYPALLLYNMEDGELCNFCHGGVANIDPDYPNWPNTTARRVLYAPSHLGLLQSDGVTEVPAPVAPRDGDEVSSTVNFPLGPYVRVHRAEPNIAYKISIPGSVFGEVIINPSNHMSWYYGADMVTWDTTLEANGQYTVSITPYDPVTLVESNPVNLTLFVNNATLADIICTLMDKVNNAEIDNEGIRNSLYSKASNACKAAQKDNMEATRGILNAFRNHVEAQKGKHIEELSADALIAFVDFLLSQL